MNKSFFCSVLCFLSAGIFSQTLNLSFNITQFNPPPTPTVTSSNNGVFCQGSFVTLSSSSATGNTWSNGATTQNINVSTVGSYSVTVTSNGCSSTSSPVTVTSTSINISVNTNSPSCGASDGTITATISGGQAPYNVQWSNGDFGLTADSLSPGQYVVQVTDASGCYNSLTVNLNPTNGPSLSTISQSNVTCNGGSNGAIIIGISGGTSPFSILWSDGSTTPTVSNLSAGVYDLVVTDAIGCVVNSSFNITEPNPVVVSLLSSPSGCLNNDGSLNASVSGGTSPYTFQWSSNTGSQTTSSATNLATGVYSVQVTDNVGCVVTASGPVTTSNVGPVISNIVTPALGCGNLAVGSINITPSGGVGPYIFHWSNGASTEDVSGLSPGNYFVVVTGSNGCSTSDTFNIVNTSVNSDPEICIVTVDSLSQKNKVIWEKPGNANGIKEYKIYREGSVLNSYNHVRTIPYDSLSEYNDSVADPSVRSWRYKITLEDSCGVETVLSPIHKTIHLSVNMGGGNSRNLAWDASQGFPYVNFEVWRNHASTGWVKLDSLPSNIFNYSDANPPSGGTLDYLVEVKISNSCNSTRGVINTTRSNVRNIVAPLSTGIDDLNLMGVKIFPNPAQNNFSISITSNENSKMNVTLFDVRGREVMQTQRVLTPGKNLETFNISDIESGVYFINIQVGEKLFRTKLVKEN